MMNFLNKKRIIFILLAILIAVFSFYIIRDIFCISAVDMTTKLKRESVTGNELDEKFINGTADFSVNLLQNSTTMHKNTLVSPMSAYFALGMTANGADGNTKSQFKNVLCKGIDIEEVNKYYYTLCRKVTDDKEISSNCSIWYNKEFSKSIKKDFLQKDIDYYGGNIFKTNFAEKYAVDDINKWVSRNTNGKIKEMVSETDKSDIMILLNTLYFNKNWQKPYEKSETNNGRFSNINGTTSKCEFMNSIEDEYVHDDLSEGFIKNYDGGKVSFVCMLPKKDVGIERYLSSLTGASFLKYMKSRESIKVSASMPSVKFKYSIVLNDALNKMGLKDAFDSGKADFTKMCSNRVYISKILQKSYIDIGLNGTEAAAATEVEIIEMSAATTLNQPKIITLNRPFVFAIVDNKTNLPLFMGVVVQI